MKDLTQVQIKADLNLKDTVLIVNEETKEVQRLPMAELPAGAKPDEEDITGEKGVLQFKDRNFDQSEFSGLGSEIKRKNIIDTNSKDVELELLGDVPNTNEILNITINGTAQTILIHGDEFPEELLSFGASPVLHARADDNSRVNFSQQSDTNADQANVFTYEQRYSNTADAQALIYIQKACRFLIRVSGLQAGDELRFGRGIVPSTAPKITKNGIYYFSKNDATSEGFKLYNPVNLNIKEAVEVTVLPTYLDEVYSSGEGTLSIDGQTFSVAINEGDTSRIIASRIADLAIQGITAEVLDNNQVLFKYTESKQIVNRTVFTVNNGIQAYHVLKNGRTKDTKEEVFDRIISSFKSFDNENLGAFKGLLKDRYSGTGITSSISTTTQLEVKVIDRPKTMRSNVFNGSFKANTRYEIRYDFDLNRKEITVPEGVVLEFKGGKFFNGTLVGNNTTISADLVKIFERITFKGSFTISKIYPEWFGASSLKNATTNDYAVVLPTADKQADSAGAINSGILLSVLSGARVCLTGGSYCTYSTVNVPDNVILELYKGASIIPYLSGRDEDLEGNKIYSLTYDSYIPTNRMGIAVRLSPLAMLVGDGVICSHKSRFSIMVYQYGYGYRSTDMTFRPKVAIRVIGNEVEGVRYANSDAIRGIVNPNAETGENGDTYLNTLTLDLFRKTTGTWSKYGVASRFFNTAMRVEVSGNDNRLINTENELWAIFLYRGIEVIQVKGGWYNMSVWKGTISNMKGNYITIIGGPGVHDMSLMTYQTDNGFNKDNMVIYNHAGSFWKFGFTWDLPFISYSAPKHRFIFGEKSNNNICQMWDDNRSFYLDYGTNNQFPAKEEFVNIFNDVISIDNQYRNIFKNRTPQKVVLNNYGFRDGVVRLKTDIPMEELRDVYKFGVAPSVQNPRAPQLWYDETLTNTLELSSVDPEPVKALVIATLGSDAAVSLVQSSGYEKYIQIEFEILNPVTGTNYNFTNKANSPHLQYSLVLAGVASNNYTGVLKNNTTTNSSNGTVGKLTALTFKFNKDLRLGQPVLTIKVMEDNILPVAVRIYNIKVYVKLDTFRRLPLLNAGATADRPDAAVKGQLYEDTTINATMINKGDSTVQNWVELPDEKTGVWTIATGSDITVATANYSKIGKQVNLAGQLTFSSGYAVNTNVPVILPFAPNYGGAYVIGDLTFTLANNSTSAQVKSMTTGTNKPFQLNFKTI